MTATVSMLLLWWVVTVPTGFLLGTWGWALARRGERAGRVLEAWAIVLPFAPPMLTLLARLAFGDAVPGSPSAGEERIPYYGIVAWWSFGLAIVGMPILTATAWFWSMARPATAD